MLDLKRPVLHLNERMRYAVMPAVLIAFGGALALVQAKGSNRVTPVVRAVEKVAPAVVNIYTEKILERRMGDPFGGWHDPMFDEFFRDFFESRPQRFKTNSLGSGVLIRPDGYILTNQHVVQRATHIKVKLVDNREFDARLVGADSDSDLAVLQVAGQGNLPYVEMASSADIMIGETVIAIGNPFGLSNTVTVGVVSAMGRSLQSDQQTYVDFIQTDASINPGNSGGPLLNIDGELIGINAAIYQKAQGIGFAIPIDRARRIVADLINYGEVHAPWVGLVVQDITPALARRYGVPPGRGVAVVVVEDGSPAASAGLKRGDIIVAIEGVSVGSAAEYDQRLRNQPENSAIRLGAIRGGKAVNVTVQGQAFPADLADAVAWQRIGVRVEQGAAGMRITAVRSGSPAARIGFDAGDEITAIGGRAVENIGQFRRRVADVRLASSVLISLLRGDYIYQLTVALAR